MFKALETETSPINPDAASAPGALNLHPLPPMTKALPPGFGPKLGPEHQGYNEGVKFVMDLDDNSAGALWLINTALDVDGRDTSTDQLLVDGAQLFTNVAYLFSDTPYLSEFTHSPPSPYGRLTFDLNPVKPAMIAAVEGGDTLTLILHIEIGPPAATPGAPPFSTELGRFSVTLDSSSNRSILIAGMTNSQLLAPLNAARQVTISAELTAAAAGALGAGSHVFEPTAPSGGAPVTNGVFLPATIAILPGP
jgi:hypothetical protein